MSGRTVVRGAVADGGRAGRGGDARGEVGEGKNHRGAVLLRLSGNRWRPGANSAFDPKRAFVGGEPTDRDRPNAELLF